MSRIQITAASGMTRRAAPALVATHVAIHSFGQTGTSRSGAASHGNGLMTAEQAADVILRGMDRGEPLIPAGRTLVSVPDGPKHP